jgi:hypothetical protein
VRSDEFAVKHIALLAYLQAPPSLPTWSRPVRHHVDLDHPLHLASICDRVTISFLLSHSLVNGILTRRSANQLILGLQGCRNISTAYNLAHPPL